MSRSSRAKERDEENAYEEVHEDTQEYVDYYLNKPTISPDEQFHRVISEFLDEWAKVHRPGFVAVRIVGRSWSLRSHELRDLWSRSGVSFEFHDED